jgi:two-component system, OmpR family, sensor histidine kinase CpxA
MRLNLLSKILLWVFLNLLVLVVVLYFIFNLQFNFAPQSPLLGVANERIEFIAELIANESAEKNRTERDSILQKYSETYGINFTLFTNSGEQLAGKEIQLPPEIREALEKPFQPPPGMPANSKIPPPPRRVRIERTTSPTTYWAITRIPIIEKGNPERVRGSVIAYSDSLTGNGLFFNPKPWIVIIVTILGLSALIWFPFIWNLNKSISKLTSATEQIADENFSVLVDDKRRDEIGRLGKSVNHLAERLAGFVYGQKRFLGDISHELNSPLARLNWALTLLENKTEPANQKYIENAREEVQLMTKLVDELLTYSKAGMKESKIQMESVNLRQMAEEVVEREKFTDSEIKIEIDENLKVQANRNFLSKALSNVLRNAVRYAGDKGEIILKADQEKETVTLKIIDSGEGVPEEELSRVFEPLYRVEKDRARKTGGSGLGLAIVKTCIEACDGKVYATNLTPRGFAINILLKS